MTDTERIERVERTLATLIHWLHRELGTANAQELLRMLEAKPEPARDPRFADLDRKNAGRDEDFR